MKKMNNVHIYGLFSKQRHIEVQRDSAVKPLIPDFCVSLFLYSVHVDHLGDVNPAPLSSYSLEPPCSLYQTTTGPLTK